MDPQDVTVGFQFTHPTQGACKVISASWPSDRVRYSFGTPGWPAQHAVTTRAAIVSLIDAGVLTTI